MVLKTVYSTLIFCVIAIIFLFNLFTLFLPQKCAAFFDMLNIKQLTISLTRESFYRSGDINDVSLLIERSVKYKDYDYIIKFVPKIKSYEKYEEFAIFKDSQEVSPFSNYKSYIDGNYLIALYNKKEYAQCLELCKEHIKDGYNADNPVRFLIRLLFNSQMIYNDLVDLLKDKYYNDNQLTALQKKDLCVDIYSIYTGIKDRENALIWQEEYLKTTNQ